MATTAARQCVDALLAAGVTHAFMVPGESFLALIEELDAEPGISLVVARHEGGAAFMAEGFAKVARRPAACLGTRVVGTANLSIGMHTALQDSTPMIALLGQVATPRKHTEAFQEVDLPRFVGEVTKWAAEPASAGSVGEVTWRAGWRARSGRPGPVAVALREDILRESVPDRAFGPVDVSPAFAPPGVVDEVARALASARRPVMLLGGGVHRGGEHAAATAAALAVPVVTAWRRSDTIDNDDPHYLGQAGLATPPSVRDVLRGADLVVVVGARLSDISTDDYELLASDCRVVLVGRDAAPFAGSFDTTRVVTAEPDGFLEALAARSAALAPDADLIATRRTELAVRRARWETETTPVPSRRPGFVDQHALAAALRRRRARDAVIVNDAGNFSGWVARYQRWHVAGTCVAPTSGAMGYALPAAIGAKLAAPERDVLAIAGDGGFMMTVVELETAVRHGVPVASIVVDNRTYGTIRMHHERAGGAALDTTTLGDVDFAALARSLGADGITVDGDDQLDDALDALAGIERPTVLHVRADPDQVSVATRPP